MKRIALLMAGSLAVWILFAGCGSRPGFEADFAEGPRVDAPESGMTDEELDKIRREEAAQRKTELREMIAADRLQAVDSEREGVDIYAGVGPYRLGPGDVFLLRFAPQNEMNASFTVQPDGMVNFDLIGELPVAGMTPSDLGKTLEELYAVYLRDPIINVTMRETTSQRLYVFGEVTRPGMFELKNPTTLTHALSMAGGWKDSARMENVMVIRVGEDDVPFAFQIDIKEMLEERVVHRDVTLQNMDIVYVPEGRISATGDWIARFFRIVQPPIDAAWRAVIVKNGFTP